MAKQLPRAKEVHAPPKDAIKKYKKDDHKPPKDALKKLNKSLTRENLKLRDSSKYCQGCKVELLGELFFIFKTLPAS